MKHLIFQMDEPIQGNRQFEGFFGDLRIGVLDIETTGLDRCRNEFILGGLLDASEGKLHQVFAEHSSEEGEALKAFAQLLKPMDLVITYSGSRFDMPFLRERAARHLGAGSLNEGQAGAGVQTHGQAGAGMLTGEQLFFDVRAEGHLDNESHVFMPDPYDLDLYRVVRDFSPLKRLLPNLRQKTVEAYMGLWQSRTDEIDGGESVRLYREYERTKDPRLEEKILLHNRDDVAQLARLVRVIDKCDLQRAMHHIGFPIRAGNRLLTVSDIRIEKTGLLIEGTQGENPADFRCYELDGFDVRALFDSSHRTFSIGLPINCHRGLSLVDLRAAGLDEGEFAPYPECGSGFLVIKGDGNISGNMQDTCEGSIRGEDSIRYRECNHLIRAYLKRINQIIDGQSNSTS